MVSVGQLAAKIQAVKVGGLKKILLVLSIEIVFVKEVEIFPKRYCGFL